MKILAGRHHLGIWELIELLISENKKMEHDFRNNLQTGAVGKKQCKKSIERKSNMLRIHREYMEGRIIGRDYLYGLGRNIILE